MREDLMPARAGAVPTLNGGSKLSPSPTPDTNGGAAKRCRAALAVLALSPSSRVSGKGLRHTSSFTAMLGDADVWSSDIVAASSEQGCSESRARAGSLTCWWRFFFVKCLVASIAGALDVSCAPCVGAHRHDGEFLWRLAYCTAPSLWSLSVAPSCDSALLSSCASVPGRCCLVVSAS